MNIITKTSLAFVGFYVFLFLLVYTAPSVFGQYSFVISFFVDVGVVDIVDYFCPAVVGSDCAPGFSYEVTIFHWFHFVVVIVAAVIGAGIGYFISLIKT